jgi:tetratricopeptide (TPR) repeat protein
MIIAGGLAHATAASQTPSRGLRLIVVSTEAEASLLRDEIEAGASFLALARERSIDASAAQGGYLSVDPAGLRAEFQAALAGLAPGETSAVTRVGDRYVLLEWLTPDEERWAAEQNAGLTAIREGRVADGVARFEAAVETVRDVQALRSQLADSLRALAQSHRLQKAYGAAEDAYGRLLRVRWAAEADTDLLPMLNALADVHRFSGLRNARFDDALGRYLEALTQTRPSDRLSVAMSDGLLELELMDAAEVVMRTAVEAKPDSRELRYELAEMYAASLRYEQALDQFRITSEMDSGRPLDAAANRSQLGFIHQRMAQVYTELNRFDEAVLEFRQALEISPELAESRLALAGLLSDRGEFEDAIVEYRSVLAQNDRSPPAWYGLAKAYLRLGQLADAIAAAQRTLAIDPMNRNAQYVLGTSLTRAGRREEGQQLLQDYRTALGTGQSTDDRSMEIDLLKRRSAEILLEGRTGEALDLLRAGTGSHPNAGVLYMILGAAEAEAGEHRSAISTFQRMLDLGLGSPHLIHKSLSEAYQALGDADAAREHWLSYLETYDSALQAALN